MIKLSKTENSPLQLIKITLINLRFRKPDALLYDCWYLLFSRHFKIKLPPRKYVWGKVCTYVCACVCVVPMCVLKASGRELVCSWLCMHHKSIAEICYKIAVSWLHWNGLLFPVSSKLQSILLNSSNECFWEHLIFYTFTT